MSKRMKLALLALLGFSTACSTVKSGSKSRVEGISSEEVITNDSAPRIRVLYGVRPPENLRPPQSETPPTDEQTK
jgi:hypothetical protein